MKKECGCKFGEPCKVECLRELNRRKSAKLKLRAKWPMTSIAMAVKPHQVKAMMEKDKRLGAPKTDYVLDSEGYTAQPKWDSENHKRAYCKAHGYHDNNCYN